MAMYYKPTFKKKRGKPSEHSLWNQGGNRKKKRNRERVEPRQTKM